MRAAEMMAYLFRDAHPPSGGDSARDYSGSFPSFAVSREWRLPTTTVTLAYQDPNAEPYSGVRKDLTIRYAPAR